MMGLTVSRLAWEGLGMPSHGYPEDDISEFCTTCGAHTTKGVHTRHISSATFSNHATFFTGGEYACPACTYLYMGWIKKRFSNVVAWVDLEGKAHCISPLLSREAALEQGRVSWWDAFRMLESLPPHAPIAALLATDLNSRQWPAMRLTTRADFGLLLHIPEYESTGYASGHVVCSLRRILEIQSEVQPILEFGFSKSRILRGLLEDLKLFSKNPQQVFAWERTLQALRPKPEFLPALLSSGILKGEAHEPSPEPQPISPIAPGDVAPAQSARGVESRGAQSGELSAGQPGLF